MENALITFISGSGYAQRPDSLVTFNSLTKFTSFKKIAIVNSVSDSDIKTLEYYFDEIFYSTNVITHSVADRFLSYYMWFVKNYNKYDYVLHIDARDVIIQTDPFEWMKNNLEKKVFITTEGFVQSYSSWNRDDQSKLQNTMRNKYDFSNNFVLNSGTIGGKFEILAELFLNIYSNANRNAEISEQSIVNYFYPQFIENPIYMITDAKKDNFCILGESINWADVQFKWKDFLICNLSDEPYCIFHQWDRTKLRETILSVWGK